ncbi:hypothetical protein [Paraburkholderia elongata]|uniref:Uncharacterized protein n=1 Tax=Paraburkholderia elongata TaxID=2675747 RepID=A0A972NQW3_9BURK|nr:hypothetical protein [Paraburkholderia elongata]NPT57376.1 hypothetical protein [Paraburkholderia elongata]
MKTFREIQPADLRSATDMLPALVVFAPIEDVENLLHATAHAEPESEERVVLMEVSVDDDKPAQVALISYDQEPEYVHLFVTDRALGSHPTKRLGRIVRRLHLDKFEINWWTRRSDESWPGNRQQPFTLDDGTHSRGHAV